MCALSIHSLHVKKKLNGNVTLYDTNNDIFFHDCMHYSGNIITVYANN